MAEMVKIFDADEPSDLERQINEWLGADAEREVLGISYSLTKSNPGFWHCAIVRYRTAKSD